MNIADSNFRNFLMMRYPACFNGASQLDTTCSAIVNEDSLTLSLVWNQYGTTLNLEGLRYFKNLVYLDCNQCNTGGTTQIPALPNSLLYFDCSEMGNLDTMPPLPPGLEYLICRQTYGFTSLPQLPNSLKLLNCGECYQLTSLPALPNNLEYLSCYLCSLTAMPALPSSLKQLLCYSNAGLSSLPPLPAALDTLNCRSCPIASLPTLPSTLTFLDCSDDSLSNIPELPLTLKYLNCASNNLVSLPSLPEDLVFFDCTGRAPFNNFITLLPTLPTSLKALYCGRHQITSLPTLPAGLETLSCGSNMLTALPQLPASLYRLEATYNRLQSLPALPASLKILNCDANPLYNLPQLPDSLQVLGCSSDSLLQLPALPTTLQQLGCNDNLLSSLPELPNTLNFVDCRMNNIYCLPKLPVPVVSFDSLFMGVYITFDADKIKCIPNYNQYLSFYGVDSNGTFLNRGPLCNPTNNIYHCQSFPVMQGIVYYDKNNNGLKDAGEVVKNNVRVSLFNGSYSFSNNTGQYEIGADSIGSYNLTASAPRYFTYAPAVYNYNFTSYDTLVTGNFALQIDSIVDELTIRVTPINWAARPGFAFPYLISYENTGTTTISPDIVFDYDQLRLSYNTSSVAGVVDNNNVLSYNTGSLSPGESGSFTGFFTLKTTVPLGDTINAKATITANAFNAADSVQTIVRGAFDPNDKQATPQLSPSQVAAGKYIDYTIRFQNTGTDTAFNIVISDTLNENLQANTLQMLVSSHTCKATVKDNIVFFEFLNILLPDSNVNELKSHGFVSFRIQPQTTIIPNTIIPNKAAIYFDYNAPVITNTAGTLIKDFTVVPLKLVSFSAVPQTDNTSSLYWSTANEINTSNFVIEQGSDGSRFSAVTSVAAKGKASNAYYAVVTDAKEGIVFYRLKIVDNDGSFSYSPIIKIDRRKNAAGFSVLTNPVKDVIILNSTHNSLKHTQASLINSNGTVVRSFLIQQGRQYIDVKGLPTGIYYLRTETGSSRILVQ